jgi:hypothetical protein
MVIEIMLKTWSGISKGKYVINVTDEKAEEAFKKLIEEMKSLRENE